MKTTFLTINNWDEFLEQPGKKMIYISSPTCDCGIDVFVNWVDEYEGDLLFGIIQGDTDPITGYPSRIFPVIKDNLENLNEILMNSPSVLLYDGVVLMNTISNLEEAEPESGETTVPERLSEIAYEFDTDIIETSE
jgi:hypothetical protein